MAHYPIHVKRKSYNGNDPKKIAARNEWNRDAMELEKITNELIKKRGNDRYDYSEIARLAGFEEERVVEIMFSVDCGHSGFTIWNYEVEEPGSGLA